jgi:hypothetical protein
MYTNKLIEEFKQLKVSASEEDLNRFIADLKDAGASIIQTISAVRSKFKWKLNEVREIVLNSLSWNSEKQKFNKFNNWAMSVWEEDDVSDERLKTLDS